MKKFYFILTAVAVMAMMFIGCPQGEEFSDPQTVKKPKTDQTSDVNSTTTTTISYTVTFMKNGGTGSMRTQTYQLGTAYALPACGFTAPTGKRFGSWNTEADGSGNSYGNEAIVQDMTDIDGESIILYAQWLTEGQYAIVYNDTFGADNTANPKIFTVTENVTIAAINRDGWFFDGWFDSTSDNAKTVTGWSSGDHSADVSLWARWTETANQNPTIPTNPNAKPSYTVAFYMNGGKGSMSQMTCEIDKAYTLPACSFTAPVGKKFNCWVTDIYDTSESYQDKASFKNLSETNGDFVILFANWIDKDAHKIIYKNAKVGSVTVGNGGNPTSFLESRDVSIDPIEREDCYTFGGWYENESCTGEPLTGWYAGERTSDVSIWGKWTPIEYKIEFNANGGTGDPMAALTGCKYDEEITLPACTFTAPEGMKFRGWCRRDRYYPDWGYILYKDRAVVKNLESWNDGTHRLYAIWMDENKYNIYYNNIKETDSR